MTFFAQYISYLEYLATWHQDIQHSPTVGMKAFDVASQDEVRDNALFRTDLNKEGILMRAVAYNFNIENSTDSNSDVRKLGGFFILQRHSDTEGSDAWLPLMDKTERIGFDILERMTVDSQNRHPLFSRSVDRLDDLQANAIPKMGIGPDKNLYGFLFTFYFKPRLVDNPCNAVSRWLDAGKTPF